MAYYVRKHRIDVTDEQNWKEIDTICFGPYDYTTAVVKKYVEKVNLEFQGWKFEKPSDIELENISITKPKCKERIVIGIVFYEEEP